MKYQKKKDKYVFEKEGVHFALTVDQVEDMLHACIEIMKKEKPVYVCTVDGEEDHDETCVWDYGRPDDCIYAAKGIKKEDCKYWKAI